MERGTHQIIVVEELLSAIVVVQSHGDVIHHLKILSPVIRPVSLQQIQMEQSVSEGAHDS